jgi:hypothetical protein
VDCWQRKAWFDKQTQQGPGWGGAAYQLQCGGVIGATEGACRSCCRRKRAGNVDLKQTG